jgi:hypothetical protein
MKNISRRIFLDSLKKVLTIIPFANIIGCIQDPGSRINPEDALKNLIFVIGPWTKEDIALAEDFANRFLQAAHIVSQYLPKSADTIQKLASRFSDEDLAAEEIDLNILPTEEQEIMKALGMQLYDLIEVRFYVSQMPEWGQCIGDPLWHTKIPV